MNKYLAFDIGGTSIKYGVVNEEGKIIEHSKTDTEAHLGGRSIIEKVITTAYELLQQHQNICGIAISSAGQIDIKTGTVIGTSGTIPQYKGVEIKKLIEEELKLPVEVRNDVDCAALCEKWLGGHHTKNFITLTIGTGIGGAIIINHELYSGHSFSAGEWGHMIVEGEQFEKVASITGLIEMVTKEKGEHHWNGKEIFERYDSGDLIVQKAVRKFFKHLGIGIANLLYIFNPEKVVIGGGITSRKEKFLQELREAVKKYTAPNIYKNTEIILARHANYSGMLGAVYNFMQRQR